MPLAARLGRERLILIHKPEHLPLPLYHISARKQRMIDKRKGKFVHNAVAPKSFLKTDCCMPMRIQLFLCSYAKKEKEPIL